MYFIFGKTDDFLYDISKVLVHLSNQSGLIGEGYSVIHPSSYRVTSLDTVERPDVGTVTCKGGTWNTQREGGGLYPWVRV